MIRVDLSRLLQPSSLLELLWIVIDGGGLKSQSTGLLGLVSQKPCQDSGYSNLNSSPYDGTPMKGLKMPKKSSNEA